MTSGFWIVQALALLYSCTFVSADEPAPAYIRAIAFSPDGKTLAASLGEPATPGQITLWDFATKKPLWNHGEKTGIPALAFSPDGKTVAIGGYDRSAKLLDAATGKELTALDHPKEVRAVAFSADGKLLATACWDMAFRVWDLDKKTAVKTFTGLRDRPFRVSFSPDGKQLLGVAGSDGAKLWDLETGAEIRTWKPGYVSAAAFTPDGLWVVTSISTDASIRVWNASSGEMRLKLQGASPGNFAYSQAARALATASYNTHVCLFDHVLENPTAEQSERITKLLAKLDDDSYDGREKAGQDLRALGPVAEMALRRASLDSPSAEVRIRARRLRKELLSKPKFDLRGHTEAVDAVTFSPDGKILASGGMDGVIRLWEAATGKPAGVIEVGK